MVESGLIHQPALENIFQKIMDTNIIGLITEMQVATYVISKGYTVSVPYGNKDRYDQIWDINGKLLKVQIKTSRWYEKYTQKEAFTFSCKTSYTKGNNRGIVTKKYTEDEIDYFATFFEGQCYVVPVSECKGVQKILRFSSSVNNSNINWAKNYTFQEVIEK